jgi:hypothetical protein
MHGDRRGRGVAGLVVLTMLLVVATIVGFVAYNAGVSHGLAMGAATVAVEQGRQAAPAAPAVVPPAYPYGYYGYGWHPWHPWGFGFFGFLGPLFFLFFWIFFLRLLFWRRWGWGGGWGRGCYGRGYRYRDGPGFGPDDRRPDAYL